MAAHPIDHETARRAFPALASGFVFLENAGGSQMPLCVIEAMRSFMVESYVQTTAGYPASDRATETGVRAREFCKTFMGAEGEGKVVMGPSTTQLLNNLADCVSDTIRPGDEVVVSLANHEANAGAWARLKRVGAVVKWWGVDPETGYMDIDELERLLTRRTKIVAFPHTSNLLGNIVDVSRVATVVHEAGGRVVVDGVAYAPHGLMEVAKWDVDFYAYSTYKVYGPHMAALYGKTDALAELEGRNHFFVARDDWPYKFELGCLSWEGCAGIVALQEYLNDLAGTTVFSRESVRLATRQMRGWEEPLTERIIAYLLSKPSVRVVGPCGGDRMPTVSFVSSKMSSPRIAAHVNCRGIGVRHGHMYSHRLTEALGVPADTAFVRVSAVHYNTLQEVEQLCQVLDEVV